MKSALWTNKEKETAKALCLSGETAQSISEKLNRSRNSVIAFLHRIGLTLGKAKRKYKKVTKPKVIPEIHKPVEEAFSKFSVRLLEARYRQCRFIQDIANNPANTMICGAKTKEGHSWCPDHYSIVYRKA
jgi:hypothetical protein